MDKINPKNDKRYIKKVLKITYQNINYKLVNKCYQTILIPIIN